ncbi:MAG: hypothetical protein U0Y68_00095 [Blastocatellia bacterium]
MLRIEKVQLQGFKSFCDLTEVVFNAEGITAVVGPNGCGKSNVADALNWVIGEQRAKALRGGKMEDVIFQGSRNRPASGLAEVVLTLRVAESFALRSVEATEPPPVNTAEAAAEAPSLPSATTEIKPRPRLALAHSYNEGEKITIARRLYRTGESEYEMNGRTCRLRDIQELFAGTGLGAAHYAIIEQGRIGQVLSAKPLDRRVLIEEAAGISKFKMRQRAAELKLDAARQNLSRVTDIISEVERQQNALKRQAAKARRFQRLRSEMRNLQKWVFISEYREAQQIIQQLEAQRAAISLQEATLLQEVQQAEEERQAALLQADQQQVSLTVLRAAAAETHLQREKERQQQEYLQAQIQALTQRALQAEQEEELLSERSRLLTQETERLRETLLGLETEINTQAAQLADAEQSHATQSAQEQATEKQLETAQQQVTGAATQQERWNQLVRQFTEASERAGKTLAGLSAEELRTRAQAEALAQERSSTLARLTEIETELQTLRTELSQAQSDLLTQQAAAREAEKNLQSYQREQVMLEQRLKSLLELDERRAYFSETVQAIMQAAAQKGDVGKFKIIGTLADFIKVSPEDEAMVEVGLREELQYLLTPSFEDALRAIDFLKRENHGRATFLIMQPSIPPGEAPPGTQTASLNGGSEKPSGPGALPEIIRLIDLLGLKPELRHLIQRALPRLSQTVVAEHIQQAIAASISTNGKGNSFLTASGEFISAGHIIAGGSLSQHGSGILALKREIEELHSQTAELAATLQQREETARRCQQEVAQGIELTQRLAQQQRDVEKELLQQRTHLSQHDREQERTVTHLRVIEAEIAQAQTEQADVESKLLHAQTELTQARLALTEAVSRATATSEIITQIRQVATTRMQELSSRRADFAAKSERRKGLQNDLRRSGNESEEILRRLARLQMEAHEALAQSQELRTALLLSQEQLQVWAAQQQTQEEEVATGEAALNEVRDRLQQGEMALTRARTTLQEAREQRANTDIERTKFHAHLEHLAANCHAEIGESLTELTAASRRNRNSLHFLFSDDEPANRRIGSLGSFGSWRGRRVRNAHGHPIYPPA